MGWFDKLKERVSRNANNDNTSSWNDNNLMYQENRYPNRNPYPVDENSNGVADMLENQRPPQKRSMFKPSPIKRYDKKGQYISTLTYPLPPIKWEKKQFIQNKKVRNKDNQYL